jgi:hypothetical protein
VDFYVGQFVIVDRSIGRIVGFRRSTILVKFVDWALNRSETREIDKGFVCPLSASFSNQSIVFSGFAISQNRNAHWIQYGTDWIRNLMLSYSIRATRYVFFILLDFCRLGKNCSLLENFTELLIVMFAEVFKVTGKFLYRRTQRPPSDLDWVFSEERSAFTPVFKCPGDVKTFRRLVRSVVRNNPEQLTPLLMHPISHLLDRPPRVDDLFPVLPPRFHLASDSGIHFPSETQLCPEFIGFVAVTMILSKKATVIIGVHDLKSDCVFVLESHVALMIDSPEALDFGLMPVPLYLDGLSPLSCVHFISVLVALFESPPFAGRTLERLCEKHLLWNIFPVHICPRTLRRIHSTFTSQGQRLPCWTP